MSLLNPAFSDLRSELEKTKLKPIKIEIDDAQLIRIGVAVIIIAVIWMALKLFFNTLGK